MPGPAAACFPPRFRHHRNAASSAANVSPSNIATETPIIKPMSGWADDSLVFAGPAGRGGGSALLPVSNMT